MAPFLQLVAALAAVPLVACRCYDPSPAFPVPAWSHGAHDLKSAFRTIQKKLDAVASDKRYDTSSFSVEITSSTQSLWSHFHTARKHNATRPGDTDVDEDSMYRIASITKTFTTLGILQQHKAGNLSLDDPVDKYIPELAEDDAGALPWKDITLRILASQLSGIPREFAQSDLLDAFPDPTALGLPPATRERLPSCDQDGHAGPCSRKELFDTLKNFNPLFAPNQKSTYSNVAFELLGIVIENVSGLAYEEYITEAIFKPLGMASSSVSTPSSEEHAVLPIVEGGNFWGVDEGVQNPTGAIYSSASDMSKYVRHILTHYNSLATGVNWLLPVSWSVGMNNFYGMPFEIFRTDTILKESKRPVTFVTKGGALPGYYSLILMLEEYGLGITLLVGGDHELLIELEEIVTVELVQHAENAIWHGIDAKYATRYSSVDPSLNSSVELAASASTGLILNSFISNGTDVFESLIPAWVGKIEGPDQYPWRIQLVPTYLYKNETTQQGEIWRMTVAYGRNKHIKRKVWDDSCLADYDAISYAGLPVTEIVFWHERGLVELPAWQVTMKAEDKGEGLLVQG